MKSRQLKCYQEVAIRLSSVVRFWACISIALFLLTLGLQKLSWADEQTEASPIVRDTLALLLSNYGRAKPQIALADVVIKWLDKKIGFHIVSTASPNEFETALTRFQRFADQASVGRSFYPEADITNAKLTVVLDDHSSQTFTKYHLDVQNLFSVGGSSLSESYISIFQGLIAGDSSNCLSLRMVDREKVIRKAYMFISTEQSNQEFRHCTNQLLLGVLGLARGDMPGDTIMDSKSKSEAPSATDGLALQILYSPDVRPGARIGDILAAQPALDFSPKP